MIEVSIPKGTRDFNPEQVAKRNYIFSVLKSVFERYGYLPIETPAMENLSTLLGKYGEEGDKLLFKILNSGNFLQGIKNDEFFTYTSDANALSIKICEKGLRYDLTVPFARYVVMHRNEIAFPFKRYQIQPVWRADRPQKGRYREFYQCDIDIIGSGSLFYELELFQIINDVFKELKLDITLYFNSRKVLNAFADKLNVKELFTTFTTILDKYDKIGQEKVFEELSQLPIDNNKLNEFLTIIETFQTIDDNYERYKLLSDYLSENHSLALNEINYLLEKVKLLNLDIKITFDCLLARGLNYYTGIILEVKSNEVSIGSICGGGRYDNLTGIFGLEGLSGVGMSFGADRIYDILQQLNRFPEDLTSHIDIFIANIDERYENELYSLAKQLRNQNLRVELFHDSNVKMKKQLALANQRKANYVVIYGENEHAQKKFLLKNMKSGEQYLLTIDEIINYIKK